MTASPLIRGLLRIERGKADCPRRRVAAVLVKDGWVLSVGHNRLPVGSCAAGDCARGLLTYEEQPKDVDYEKSGCVAFHAEDSVLAGAAPEDANGATIYVTEWPCPRCARRLDKAGVAKVVRVEPSTL